MTLCDFLMNVTTLLICHSMTKQKCAKNVNEVLVMSDVICKICAGNETSLSCAYIMFHSL
jgi:hypothetical protein